MSKQKAIKRKLIKHYKVGGITFDDNKLNFSGVVDKRKSDQMLDKGFIMKGKIKAAKRKVKSRKA
jgi:hypothetical protein